MNTAASSKVNILVVDDRPDGLLAIQAVLEAPHHNIITAASGQEAISQLLQHDIAMILLDVQMPIMNGFDFLAEFDQLNEHLKKGIQIYVLSSTLDVDEIRRIKENDYVTDFLNKPLPIEDLIQKIHF